MKEEQKKDILLVLYMLTVLILAVIYFSVPERILFMENTIQWWSEWWNAVR